MRFFLLFAIICLTINDIAAQNLFKSESLLIAQNDGSMGVGWGTISNGKREGENFFYSTLPDNISKSLGRYVFFEVVMGNFTDYIIPALKNEDAMNIYEFYNVLGGGVRDDDPDMRVNSYSPVSPLDELFDGYSKAIPNDGPTIFGSSPEGFVQNGTRNVLNGWGSCKGGKGGCGFMNTTDTLTGNRPYSIIGHTFSVDYVYLGLKYTPGFYYSGQNVALSATVFDVFARNNIPEVNCVWTLKRSDSLDTDTKNGNEYNNVVKSISATDTLTLKLNVSMKAPGSKKFWFSNENTYKYKEIFFSVHTIKSNGTLLDNKAPVTRMLRFTNPDNLKDVIKTNFSDSESYKNGFFEKGDNNIRPRNEQLMKAANNDPRDVNKTYNWIWKNISSDDGVFGGGITETNTHQYFAFAFHNPIKQVINVVYECPDKAICVIYINSIKPTKDAEYEAKWYQVIVNMVSANPIEAGKGFKISFEAYSLVLSDSVRDLAPYEPENVPTTTTMTTSIAPTKPTTTSSSITTSKLTTSIAPTNSTTSLSSTTASILTTSIAPTKPTTLSSSTTASILTTSIAPKNSTTSLSSTATSPPHHVSDDSKKSKSTGIIVGCIVGVIVLIGLIVLTIFLLRCKVYSNNKKVVSAE